MKLSLKWILFTLITLFVSFIYFLTTAPTVVFWDVGEFLAASYNLGIPHPPGTPLYVIMAKFFSLLPLPLKELKEALQGFETNQYVLRVTLIPILSGGLMAGFFYLILVDSVSLFKNKDYENIWVHIAGIFVALTQAFTYSQWFNSIEAETYTPSLLSNVMALYFVLLWLKNREKPGSIKWVLLAAYVMAIATGIQAISLFGFIGLFLFLAIFQRKYIWDDYFWAVLAVGIAILVIWFNSYNILQYIYYNNALLNFQKFSNQADVIAVNPYMISDEISKLRGNIFKFNLVLLLCYIGIIWSLYRFKKLNLNSFNTLLIIILIALSTFLHFAYGSISSLILASFSGLLALLLFFIHAKLYKDWKGVGLLLVLLAIVCEFWLLARAYYLTNNPIVRINEGDPSNWFAFMDMLTRKQYGPPSPLERRIPLIEQLQVLWTYTSWQFVSIPYITREQLLPVLYLLILLMILGVITNYTENKTLFWLYMFGLVGAVIGLFIYQNPADAPSLPVNPNNVQPDPITGQVRMEVRDREYFYVLLYATIVFYSGFGLLEILRVLKKYLKFSIIPTTIGILFTFWTAYAMISNNWKYNDRHKNYIAEDFPYNILSSPISSKYGVVLFTNGDNDTFPVWFMQEVLGYRRDIFNANLSLLNTNWYIKQLKGWGAPISFSYEDIEKLPVFIPIKEGKFLLLRDLAIRDMIATSVGYKTNDYVNVLTEKGIVKIPKIYLEDGEKFVREVIIGREFKVPIYFSITCDPDAYKDYKKLFILEGLAWRINNEITGETDELSAINLERTIYLLSGNYDPIDYIENFAKKYKLAQDGIFRYRSIFDPTVYKDENHQRIYRNYATVAFSVANVLKIRGDYEKSNRYFEFGKRFLEAITQKSDMLYIQIYSVDLEIADNLIKMKKIKEAKAILDELKLKITSINDQEFINYMNFKISEKLKEIDTIKTQ
ncbi:MAG: DUF2723 domain-containing protein [candidate division WOR-3 bacterium]